MGLDTTHNAFHGAYSGFDHLRRRLVEQACQGTYRDGRDHYYWTFESERVPHDVRPGMYALLNHSDCEGDLSPQQCTDVAQFLEWADRHITDVYAKDKAAQFARGCRLAAEANETLEFH